MMPATKTMPATKALLMLETALNNSLEKSHQRSEADGRTKEAETATAHVINALKVLRDTSITAAIAHEEAAAANYKAGNTGRAKHHSLTAFAHREFLHGLEAQESETEQTENERELAHA